MAKPRKKPLSPEEQYKIEKAIRREEWLKKGCPFFKPGAHKDKRREESRTKCRRRVQIP